MPRAAIEPHIDVLIRLERSKLSNRVIRDAAAEIRRLRAENARLRAALNGLLAVYDTLGTSRVPCLIGARRALEAQPKPTDAQLARYHGDVDGDAEL